MRSQNDPPPDVLPSYEVKGEHGAAALRQWRRVSGDSGPGVSASAPPGTALHTYTVFKMTDADGWTVSGQTHLSLSAFTSITGLSITQQARDAMDAKPSRCDVRWIKNKKTTPKQAVTYWRHSTAASSTTWWSWSPGGLVICCNCDKHTLILRVILHPGYKTAQDPHIAVPHRRDSI